jgi:hypothetical protein
VSSSPSLSQAQKERIGWLKSNKAYQEAERLADCEQHVLLFYNAEKHDVKFIPRHCQSKFCPICGPKIIAETKRKLDYVIQHIDQSAMRFITLTQRDKPGECLESAAHRFMESFRKFRRHKSWANNIWGCYIKYEATWNKKTEAWHFHAHILAHGRYIPREELKKNWMSVSPSSYIIDIRRVNKSTSHELSKYVTRLKYKGTMPLGELTRYMSKHRMVTTTGSIKKIFAAQKENLAPSGYDYISTVDFFFSQLPMDSYSMSAYEICYHVAKLFSLNDSDPPRYAIVALDYEYRHRAQYIAEFAV